MPSQLSSSADNRHAGHFRHSLSDSFQNEYNGRVSVSSHIKGLTDTESLCSVLYLVGGRRSKCVALIRESQTHVTYDVIRVGVS